MRRQASGDPAFHPCIVRGTHQVGSVVGVQSFLCVQFTVKGTPCPLPPREQISVAFFDLIAGAADFTGTSRRFVHWDQVNETQMPFLTMLKTGEVRGRQSKRSRFETLCATP